jgi:hypothetical protein
VPHSSYRADRKGLLAMLSPGGVLVDVKGMFAPNEVPASLSHWRL